MQRQIMERRGFSIWDPKDVWIELLCLYVSELTMFVCFEVNCVIW
jgi:hypothetical protein